MYKDKIQLLLNFIYTDTLQMYKNIYLRSFDAILIDLMNLLFFNNMLANYYSIMQFKAKNYHRLNSFNQ